jgi:disulfide bond formation protein DsbB
MLMSTQESNVMTPGLSRTLNVFFMLAICAILLGAFTVQFAAGELPCPLCLLQRLAFFGVGFGAMLNVVYGARPRHYGVALLSAIFGGAVAGRQILLHIAPGDPGYGSAFLGLHLYTWSFIAFVGTGAVLAIMLLLDSQFGAAAAFQTSNSESEANARSAAARSSLGIFARLAVALLITIVAANLICTVLLCGAGPCDGNPTHYQLLSH